MTANSIAISIRAARERKMISRRELCKMARVPYATMSAAEAGTHLPSVLALAACAKALNISIGEYIGEK